MAKEIRVSLMRGDFIGPEIIEAARRVLAAAVVAEGGQLASQDVVASGEAMDACGHPLPATSIEAVRRFDSAAILKGPFGGPPAEANHPKWRDVERLAILPLRREFKLYANLRPVRAIRSVSSKISPLREQIVDGVDLLFVRELLGGMYFGDKRRETEIAIDTESYTKDEVRRVTEVACHAALARRRRVTLVHKSNVLETGRLWREVVEGEFAPRFTDLEFNYRHVDDAAMQLNTDPAQFDVILTTNMFGDILSDQASTIVGGLGFCGSASLGASDFGIYEPIHGSAPDIAGKDVANPISAFRSAALLLRYSAGMPSAADRLDGAVDRVLQAGVFTPDVARLAEGSATIVGTRGFTDRVQEELEQA